eukprot:m.53456 g.53456  ORF g.53456 m.53456 type:complete len:171 (-) comp21765_c0_seq1:49-561(-)
MSLNLERQIANAARKKKDAHKPHLKKEVEIKIFKTIAEEQAWRLSKLMEQPDKEACIPEPPKEREQRGPREFNPNVMGSTAGAGSGEYHVYRQDRAKEHARLKHMDKVAEKNEQEKEFYETQAKRKLESDQKAAKKQSKKKKHQRRKKELKDAATAAKAAAKITLAAHEE